MQNKEQVNSSREKQTHETTRLRRA